MTDTPPASDPLAGVSGLLPEGAPPAEPATAPAPATPPAIQATPPAPPEEEDEEIVVPPGAENPDAVRAAIRAERKAARDANARARAYEAQLREREEQQVPLEDKERKAREEATQANLRALRYEVAAQAGLDLKLADRLKGATAEELLADAETFKGYVGTAAPLVPPEGGTHQPPPTKEDPNKAHNNLLAALLAPTQAGASVVPSSTDPLAGLQPAPDED